MQWNPSEQYAKDADTLPIHAPPCPGCAHWRPIRQHDSSGAFIGVRLCQADEMRIDFTCFSEAKAKPAPATQPADADAWEFA